MAPRARAALAVLALVPALALAGPRPSGAEPSPAPFASFAQAADRLHEDLFARTPTPAERAPIEAGLADGSQTSGDYAASTRTSPDHRSAVDPAARLYRAFFLRIPDKAGLEYWVKARRAGLITLVRMAATFAGSSEFQNRYGTLTNRQFVELVYANVLERPGDAAGLDYWTRQLDQRRHTRGSTMVGFSESSEYQREQASETHVSVLTIFLLGRSPTPSEFADSVAALDGGLPVPDYAASLIASPAYAQRLASQRVAIFGDSVPDQVMKEGAAGGADLSSTTLVHGAIGGCDGAQDPPPARIRSGSLLTISAACQSGWPSLYPPLLAVRADRALVMTGPHAMLDHRFDGVWRHPCHAPARSWYRIDIKHRLQYLATRADRVVLVLPAWPGPNSGWVMPTDYVKRADCVREEMLRAAVETGTPVIDLGARICPTGPTTCLRYRDRDGVHIDGAKAPEILDWLLASSSPAGDPTPPPPGPPTTDQPAPTTSNDEARSRFAPGAQPTAVPTS